MTEGIETSGQNLDATAAQPVSQPVTQAEKMVPQSVFDKTVVTEKRKEYERGKRDALSEYSSATAQPQSHESQPKQQSSMGGMQQMTAEDVRKLINEERQKGVQEYQKQQIQSEAQKIATDFQTKMGEGKEKYPDFEESVSILDANEQPHLASLVLLTKDIPNTADVMYYLSKNTGKVSELLTLAHTAPRAAESAIKVLSGSLQNNEQALNSPKAPKPLSQVKASMTATDTGELSLGSIKRDPRYRG